MQFIFNKLNTLPEYTALRQLVCSGAFPMAVTGVSHIHKAVLFAALLKDCRQKGLLLTPTESDAAALKEDIEALGLKVLLYPARDFIFHDISGSSHEYEHARLDVLCRMISGDYDVCISAIDAALQYTLPPERLKQSLFTVKSDDDIDLLYFTAQLISAGYKKCEQVDGPGQFAVRGGIIDIFTPGLSSPVRIELWDTAVDSISMFDVITQRRTEQLSKITISPAREVLFASDDELADRLRDIYSKLDAAAPAKRNLEKCMELISAGAPPASYDRFIGVAYKKPATLLDYISGGIIAASESTGLKERCRTSQWQIEQDVQQLLEEGVVLPQYCEFALSWDAFLHCAEKQKLIILDTFPKGNYDVHIKGLQSIALRQSPPWNGSLETLVEDIQPVLRSGGACVVLAGLEKAAAALASDLSGAGIAAAFIKNPDDVKGGMVTVTTGGLSGGFEFPGGGFCLITKGRYNAARRTLRKKSSSSKGISSLEEINKGDYIVHAAHGIGIYDGVEKKTAGGITKDYIKIKYAKGDVLYVPVTQLDLVSKYIGPSSEDGHVKVNRLGGTEWAKTKRRVKSAVKDLAKQLTALYASRMNIKGFAFSEDTDMQNDFERRFEYEETDDQLRSAAEIKADMERPVPMDRLLCGDVGFGKTEVALRAAFKCIADSKQCAILVPTTILALQHYQTIISRMQGMPVNVELLSRFRSPKQQKEILKRVKSGEIDIIVGTHRLVSKDVVFKDLGLLIVDEEQRFGVAQKEKLKESFPAVDVLTLSATPIPRTLNMAMSGLRDMSVIEEAPQDRHPVQTYVLEYDSGILLDAIRRELRRGGQVYYIHNKIDSIDKLAVRLASQLDGARVAAAHGRMSESELSDIWRRLLDHEIDVLVCTTIIETGVDVPNVNTLIIEDADHMGLSQLHQLRGRVGRSPRRAYAYLTFRRGKALTDIAYKRLESIREYTEFGSGFKIAMRDLEIRGAGNILGGEQHGHMESVGYDMYVKLLNEAISEEKGQKSPAEEECAVDMQIQAHIPENYISANAQRLSIYRRIADIRTRDDADDVIDELIDRFGDPPKSVLGLIDISLLRSRAAALGMSEIVQKGQSMLFFPRTLDMEKISGLVSAMKGRVLVSAGQRPYVSVKIIGEPFDTALSVLDTLTAQSDVPQA